MRATFSIIAAAVVSAVVFVAPAGAETADNPRIAASSSVRLANGCPDRPRIHVRRYGQRGGGAPTRCPPQG
jgi:hypothetical protein